MKTYNPIFYPGWGLPFIPTDYDVPPTLYSLCNSIANFGKLEKTKIKDLAEQSKDTIFDFDYPLSSKVNKDDFEKMIINHFLMRRIGFETFTAFQIALNTKLNEIMPEYNILFDSLSGWDLFKDGEKVTLTSTDTKTGNAKESTSSESSTNDSTSSTADRKYSDTPQNQIQDVKDGRYVTEYNFDEYGGYATANSESQGQLNRDTKENGTHTETIERTPGDKIRLYEEFKNNMNHIYSMIFRELEDLFFQLV